MHLRILRSFLGKTENGMQLVAQARLQIVIIQDGVCRMDEILFDGYRKYQKGLRGNIIKTVLRLPVGAIIIVALAFTSMVLSYVFQFVELCQWLSPVFFLVEILTCISSHFYIENFRIRTSDKRLVSYYEYCHSLYTWIKSTEITASEQNIQIILDRVEKRIALLEGKRKHAQDTIWHIVNILIIPLLLAIFSSWMKDQTNLPDLIAASLSIIFFVGSIGLLVYLLYNVFSIFQKHRIEQLRCFSEDLQGILDTQFEGSLFCAHSTQSTNDLSISKHQGGNQKKLPENTGKAWTSTDDTELCHMYDSKCAPTDICAHLKRSKSAVAARLVRLGKIKERKDFYR